jgi:hypothetical protein
MKTMPNTREKLEKLLRPWLAHLSLVAANDLIANGVTVQKWIPVTERLPNNREDVLVVAFWHERWNVQWGWYAPNGKVWHIGLMEETDYPVSHWMPLPEPPKGE